MNHKLAGSLAAAAVLSLGIAACSSSPSGSSGSSGSATGKPLVIETTALSPMVDNFNPFDSTGTGYMVHATDLYNLPLFVFDTLRPTEQPIPELGTNYQWSNGGRTLTLTIRSGVKWSDGKSVSASDVAYTFNLLAKHTALNVGWPQPTPAPVSATAPSATTAVLTFSQPQYASLYDILQTVIVPEHVWASVSNPATFADPQPVSDGPYVLHQFSAQGFTMTINPDYYAKSTVRVPEVDFPSYTSNANLVPPVASGQIDWAGNSISGIQQNYLAKSPDNHTWQTSVPYLSDNNVVGLWFNVTKKPLNDPAVRQAISYGIDRQQLSVVGESNTEPIEDTSSGLMLPADESYLDPTLSDNLPSGGDPAKVKSILTADGYKMVGKFWEKSGQKISFSIMDPVQYSDYYQDSQLIAKQLDAEGFDVAVDGIPGTNGANVWSGNMNVGNFSAAIHWGAQGLTPYFYYNNWMNYTQSAPIGQTAGGDWGRFDDPAAQAALNEYASTNNATTQAHAITQLENIMSTQVPVAPLLLGAAWAEVSTRDYTGWPSQSDPYMDPGPNIPEILYTVQQLKPVS
jgi:peptide/nickel transport system substrate-binding protein